MANNCVKALPPCELRTPKYAPLVREGFSLFFIQISPSDNEQLERDVLRHDVISFGVEPLTKRSQGEALLSAAPLAPREKSEIFPAGAPGEITKCRTEGIAIATQSVNRVRCPLKPWGPFGGNGRGPRRKYFRWGNLGGTRRRGLNNTSMSGDGSPFQTWGRKARMGLPAKCMHFVGSPGWRGNSNSPASTNSLTIPCTPVVATATKKARGVLLRAFCALCSCFSVF